MLIFEILINLVFGYSLLSIVYTMDCFGAGTMLHFYIGLSLTFLAIILRFFKVDKNKVLINSARLLAAVAPLTFITFLLMSSVESMYTIDNDPLVLKYLFLAIYYILLLWVCLRFTAHDYEEIIPISLAGLLIFTSPLYAYGFIRIGNNLESIYFPVITGWVIVLLFQYISQSGRLPEIPFPRTILLLPAVSLLATLQADYFFDSYRAWIRLLTPIPVFILLYSIIKRTGINRWLTLIMVIFGMHSLLFLWRIISSISVLGLTDAYHHRLTLAGISVNGLAAYLAISVPLILVATAWYKNNIAKAPLFILALTAMAGVIYTGSRGSLLGLIVGLFCLSALVTIYVFPLRRNVAAAGNNPEDINITSKLPGIKRIGLIISMIALASILLILSPRLFDLRSIGSRLYIQGIALDIIKSNPFMGVGLDQRAALSAYAPVEYSDTVFSIQKYLHFHTHNILFEFTVTMGLMGLAALIILAAGSIIFPVRNIKSIAESRDKWLLAGSISSILSFWIISQFILGNSITTYIPFQFWILMALLTAVISHNNDESKGVLYRISGVVALLLVFLFCIQPISIWSTENSLTAGKSQYSRSAAYDSLIRWEPFNAHYRAMRGQLQIERGNLLEALQCYDKALDLRPDFPIFLVQRGWLRILLGDNQGGSKDLQRALEVDHMGIYGDEHYSDAAVAAIVNGDYNKALDLITDGMSVFPDELIDPWWPLGIEKQSYRNRMNSYLNEAWWEWDDPESRDREYAGAILERIGYKEEDIPDEVKFHMVIVDKAEVTEYLADRACRKLDELMDKEEFDWRLIKFPSLCPLLNCENNIGSTSEALRLYRQKHPESNQPPAFFFLAEAVHDHYRKRSDYFKQIIDILEENNGDLQGLNRDQESALDEVFPGMADLLVRSNQPVMDVVGVELMFRDYRSMKENIIGILKRYRGPAERYSLNNLGVFQECLGRPEEALESYKRLAFQQGNHSVYEDVARCCWLLSDKKQAARYLYISVFLREYNNSPLSENEGKIYFLRHNLISIDGWDGVSDYVNNILDIRDFRNDEIRKLKKYIINYIALRAKAIEMPADMADYLNKWQDIETTELPFIRKGLRVVNMIPLLPGIALKDFDDLASIVSHQPENSVDPTAETWLKSALWREPDRLDIYYALASYYLRTGRPEEANHYLQIAHKIHDYLR